MLQNASKSLPHQHLNTQPDLHPREKTPTEGGRTTGNDLPFPDPPKPSKQLMEKLTRIKYEHDFFIDGIEKIIQGYTEQEFLEKFINFFEKINFANISEAQRQLIYSQAFEMNNIGLQFRQYIEDF